MGEAMTISNKRHAALLFFTLPLGSCALALTTSPITHRTNNLEDGLRRPCSLPSLSQQHVVPSRRSPLFVAVSLDQEGEAPPATPAPILREIEKKLERAARQREKAAAKLSKVEETLQNLEAKKQEYLEGAQLAEAPVGGNFSETAVRSAVKAMLWRVIAGLVTLITSLRFSGSLATALSIVGSDFFSKALTMFIGERIMNKSQAGRKSGADNLGRSLAKALLWRLFAICNTLTMSLFFAKDLKIASKIAGSDAIFKTGLMFVYERAWARIEWGKEYLIEFAI